MSTWIVADGSPLLRPAPVRRGVRTAVTASAPATALLLGALIGLGRYDILVGLVLLIGVPLFVIAAPARLVLWMLCLTALVEPTLWPRLTAAGQADLYLGDALMVLGGAAALARRRETVWHRVVLALVAFVALGLAGSAVAGSLSLLRVMEPVLVGAVVGLSLRRGFDVWRDARWFCVAVIMTLPLFGNVEGRWTGWPGGPNETALVAAVALVLGAAERNRATKVVLLAVGVTGLVGARGIAATAGAVAGLAVLSLRSNSGMWRLRMGRVSPVLVASTVVLAALMLPVVRPDFVHTLYVHKEQALTFTRAWGGANPLLGTGWRNADQTAFTFSTIREVHNVYLDIAVYLGVLGLALFLLLLWFLLRAADPVTRAVLVTVAVWLNTIGAFPGAGWGLLGVVTAASLCRGGPVTPSGKVRCGDAGSHVSGVAARGAEWSAPHPEVSRAR